MQQDWATNPSNSLSGDTGNSAELTGNGARYSALTAGGGMNQYLTPNVAQNRRLYAVAPLGMRRNYGAASSVYGSYGKHGGQSLSLQIEIGFNSCPINITGGSSSFGLGDFLTGDFDIGIDGDLLVAGIAAAAAAFFLATYIAVTTGRKKRDVTGSGYTNTREPEAASQSNHGLFSSFLPDWISGKKSYESTNKTTAVAYKCFKGVVY